MTNGWYNNTQRDVITNLSAAIADVEWTAANKWGSDTMYSTLYGSTQFSESNFPLVAKFAACNNIRFGGAFSAMSEVNNAINYNNAQTDPKTKLTHMVTEYEPYNDSRGYPYMTTLYQNAAPLIKANGMKLITYMGWPVDTYWDTIVQYSDEIHLHCYKPASGYTESSFWSYVSPRLGLIAAACKKINKKMHVNILYSCEAAFGAGYYANHSWWNGHQIFLRAWDANATADMKKYLRCMGAYMFVTKEGKKIK